MSNPLLQPEAVIVLAAGQGTRMKSNRPKVLHTLAGCTLIEHVLRCAYSMNPKHVLTVVRHQAERVSETILQVAPETQVVHQDAIPGTGRAAEQALEHLEQFAGQIEGQVIILSGDVPLISAETLCRMMEFHRESESDMTVLTATVENPYGFGRILRDTTGAVLRIIEEKDASAEEKRIREINGGVYVCNIQTLHRALRKVTCKNAQHEKYLTDALALILQSGGKVCAWETADHWDIAGVNDRSQLADVSRELNRRIVRAHQLAGVTILRPETVSIDLDVQIAEDVEILQGTILRGETSVGRESVIGPDSTIEDSVIGEGVIVRRSELYSVRVADGVTIGPFSYVRPETELGKDVKIGAFVEVKKSTVAQGAKIPHLSYVGDATIGRDVNLGAGTIVANYDGVKKHPTVIGDGARIGSKTVLVAPVTIEEEAYTGAGAIIRENVPAQALAVSSLHQRNIEGWVARKRAEAQ